MAGAMEIDSIRLEINWKAVVGRRDRNRANFLSIFLLSHIFYLFTSLIYIQLNFIGFTVESGEILSRYYRFQVDEK